MYIYCSTKSTVYWILAYYINLIPLNYLVLCLLTATYMVKYIYMLIVSEIEEFEWAAVKTIPGKENPVGKLSAWEKR